MRLIAVAEIPGWPEACDACGLSDLVFVEECVHVSTGMRAVKAATHHAHEPEWVYSCAKPVRHAK